MEMAKIIERNPWWQNKENINKDEKIVQALSGPIYFSPKFEIKKNNIYIIRGPRQVGKTTLLKLKIKELLEMGIEPRSLFFYSCDQFRRAEQIIDIIEEYIRWCEPQGISPFALFLDEITAISNWARAIKHIKDSGIIRDAIIVLTGSNSVDLKQGSEKLPGRGIEGNEYFYYPLCFRAFCNIMGKKLPDPVGIDEFLLKEKDAQFVRNIYDLSMDSELKKLFNIYMQSGGFLLALNNYKKGMGTTFETYARWIEGDLVYFKKDIRFAKQILATLSSKNASQVSINTVAKNTEIASPVTVKDYLSVFEEMQILLPLYKYNLSSKQLDYKKEKKYHFIDPLLYALVSRWTETKQANEEAIIEGIVASHVYRFSYVNKLGIGFYNDGKYEVDVLVKSKERFIPIEVKWANKINTEDWKGLYKMGKGILLTKNNVGFEKGRYLKIPVPVFLALLDIPVLIPIQYA